MNYYKNRNYIIQELLANEADIEVYSNYENYARKNSISDTSDKDIISKNAIFILEGSDNTEKYINELTDKMHKGGYLLCHYEVMDNTAYLKFKILSVNFFCESAVCTGCGACRQICPKEAISLESKNYGAIAPVIDFSKCINCKQCLNVCPSINPVIKNKEQEMVLATWSSDEERINSSSGGIFSQLAKIIINRGGIVFGVAWTKEFTTKHIKIETIQELKKLNKSKYLRSDTANTFAQVKNYLENNVEVLYSGTPCQISGIVKFLGKEYKNLYLIDLVCSYSPDSTIFSEWLNQNYDIDSIEKIDFRDKKRGWNCTDGVIKCEGKEIIIPKNKFLYQLGFLRRQYCSDVCGRCSYASLDRVGDITLGDFWRIEKYDEKLTDNYGTSMVSVNTDKGRKLFDNCIVSLEKCVEVPNKYAVDNHMNQKRQKPSIYRDRFFDLFNKYGFNKAFEYVNNNKWDICVVGCWSNRNFGSCITYMALYELLNKLGYEVLMLEQPKSSKRQPLRTPYLCREVIYKAYDVAPPCETKEELFKYNSNSDTFLVGSDQLWGKLYNAYDSIHTLDFVLNKNKRIAYSTSIGDHDWNDLYYDRNVIKYNLQKFDDISVREEEAVKQCIELFEIEANLTLDPIFLVDPEYYNTLIKKSTIDFEEEYIGGYFIGVSNESIATTKKLAKETNAKCNIVLDPREGTHKRIEEELNNNVYEDIILKDVYEEDWLNFIKNCKLLVTDSFHATCMAIIFNVPFVTKANYSISRYETILSMLNLKARLYYDYETIELTNEIISNKDIISSKAILEEKRISSIQWLKNAIAKEPNKDLSEMMIIRDEIAKAKYEKYLSDKNIEQLKKDKILLAEKNKNLSSQINKINQNIKASEKVNLSKSSELNKKIDENKKEMKKEINKIKKSPTFKLERVILFIPRKIKKIFKKK